MSQVSSEKRALEMLTKLLRAARLAHEGGKEIALGKIIDEASKITNKLKETSSNERYIPVFGEII